MLNSRFYYCWGMILQNRPPQYLPCCIHLLAIKLYHSSQLDWGLHSLPLYLSGLLTGAEVMSLSRLVVKDYTASKFNIVFLGNWLLEHSLHDTRKLKRHVEWLMWRRSTAHFTFQAGIWAIGERLMVLLHVSTSGQPPGDFTLQLTSYPQPFSHPSWCFKDKK